MTYEITVSIPKVLKDFMATKLGVSLSVLNGSLSDDFEMVAMRNRVRHILLNPKIDDRSRNILYKNCTETFTIVGSVKSITPLQNNRINRELWDWFKKELYFEMAISSEPSMCQKIATFIEKYKLHDSADIENLRQMIYWKRKKKEYVSISI